MRRNDSRKRTETLDYIQSMLGQLRVMAENERHDMLAFLIEMAFIEAGEVACGERPSRSGRVRGDSAA
jgi:hypothetical protein